MENEINTKGKSEMQFLDDLGHLYLREADAAIRKIEFHRPTEEEIEKIPAFLCDSISGNAHMMPDDFNLAELCSAYIYEKGTNILKCIKEEIKINKLYKNINCNQKYLSRAKMFDGTDFENRKYLFSYVGVTCNNTNYDLVFNRFFFDKNNNVNCILLCPQIEMYDKSLKGSKKRDKDNPPRTKDYPDTPANFQGNAVYYNLGVDILDLSSEKIAKAFLKFVIDTEKEKVDSKG